MFNDTTVLWDQLGQPCCFITGDWVFSLQGHMLGFTDKQGAVYNQNRVHVAWFEDGVMRDQRGQCLALAETPSSSAHPPVPFHRFPAPPLPKTLPPFAPPMAAIPASKPQAQYRWSSLNVADIFR